MSPEGIKALTPGMLHMHFMMLIIGMGSDGDPDTIRTLYALHHEIEGQPGTAGGPDDYMESDS